MNEAWASMLARVEKRRDVDARFYKPTCLIAVIDGIADGSLAPSDIDPDRVITRFAAYIGDFFPERAGLGWRPFWHLSRDDAWIFTRNAREVGPEEFGRERKPNSRRELMAKIDRVAVPDKLRTHWRSAADRAELRAALIAMLRRDNEDCRRLADHLDRQGGFSLEVVPAPDATSPVGRKHSRQGYMQSPEARRACERRAMKIAAELLLADGWHVEDVSTRRSYDLHATRGEEIMFVEVKGTIGDGTEIRLTAAEVTFATLNRDHMVLIIVAHIGLSGKGAEMLATGGTPWQKKPWSPHPADLSPITYLYRAPRDEGEQAEG